MLREYHFDFMPSLKPIPIGEGEENSWWKSIKEWQTNSRKFMLIEDWYYTLPDGTKIMVPKGFIFDGASVPRFLWPVLDPFGILLIPGLVHDFGYRYDFLLDEHGMPIMIDAGREYFDGLFEKIAEKSNGLFITNKAAWRSLRVFGGIAWNSNRKIAAEVYWTTGKDIREMWEEVLVSYDPNDYYLEGTPRNVYLADCITS